MSIIRVLITGSRAWENPEPIRKVLKRLVANYGIARILVIEGGAAGVDYHSKMICEELGIHCLEMKARWNMYNRAAGPIRNEMMLSLDPHIVVAFHWDLEDSKGTKQCYESAKKKGIKAVLIKVPMEIAIPSGDFFKKAKETKTRRRKRRADAGE